MPGDNSQRRFWNLEYELEFLRGLGTHAPEAFGEPADPVKHKRTMIQNYLDSIQTRRSVWWPGFTEGDRQTLIEAAKDALRDHVALSSWLMQ